MAELKVTSGLKKEFLQTALLSLMQQNCVSVNLAETDAALRREEYLYEANVERVLNIIRCVKSSSMKI